MIDGQPVATTFEAVELFSLHVIAVFYMPSEHRDSGQKEQV